VNLPLHNFLKFYVNVTFIQMFTSEVSSETRCVLIVEKAGDRIGPCFQVCFFKIVIIIYVVIKHEVE